MRRMSIGTRMTMIVLLALTVTVSCAQVKSPGGAKQPTAGGLQNPIAVHGENWRGKPHYEVLIMNRNAEGPGGAGNYYNSIGLTFALSNEEMDARFRALDPEKLKQQYGGDGVRFNGPRRLVVNRWSGAAMDNGNVFLMGQIPMYVYGTFSVPNFDAFIAGKQLPYVESVSKRTSTWYYDAGEQVYELVAPDGAVFTMFSSSLKVDPNNTIDRLPTLGERLKKLPAGWAYRARTLEKDLVISATYDSDPPNTVVLDEFENNYNRNREASTPAPGVPYVLSDGVNASHKRVDGLHLTRYIEMFLAARSPDTGSVVAACYNSMFTSKGIPASRDTAPQVLVEGLDFDKLKNKYSVLGASLNGPKLWTPDWSEFEAGAERSFNGIPATWVAQLNMGGDGASGVSESTPYQAVTIARKSGIGWNKGTTVLLLDDADGNTWIMKGFQLGLKPQHTYNEFISGGASMFKKLPPGWKVRVKTLEKDLIERPENGVATIMPDEHFNVYDKTGPGMTNYTP
ncbi:hypothetical protein [Desulfosarcina variabilis]|uniref:hypothetical protein n=1 Tax=Desulfosarcina variabilis TaxID=2300 RepID=UPI003AFA21E4